jgi:uncharacterized protein (TIGR00251 family)
LKTWTVVVKPGSSKGPAVEVTGDNSLLVFLHARPVEGQANRQLVEVVAKHFGVPKSAVTIRKGAKSRTKFVEVDN